MTNEVLRSFHFPEDGGGDSFRWTLVSLQRSISLGLDLRDEQLGNWISQYGLHLENSNRVNNSLDTRMAKRFVFDPTKPYDGTCPSFDRLTAYILGAPRDSKMRKYAERWDAAIVAMHDYQQMVATSRTPSQDQMNVWKAKMSMIRDIFDNLPGVWEEDLTVAD